MPDPLPPLPNPSPRADVRHAGGGRRRDNMDRDDILRALVKPPQWQDGGVYSGSAAWLSFNEKGRFCYGVDLGGIFYMQTPDGEQEGFPTLAAAQAAAEADYRARIVAGAPIYLTLLGSAHPPVCMDVGEVP